MAVSALDLPKTLVDMMSTLTQNNDLNSWNIYPTNHGVCVNIRFISAGSVSHGGEVQPVFYRKQTASQVRRNLDRIYKHTHSSVARTDINPFTTKESTVLPTGHPPTGVPLTGHPPTGVPLAGHPPTGVPLAGHPPTGVPLAGHPPTGVPLTWHPPTGVPLTWHPPTGVPPPVHPPTGVPPTGHPPSGVPIPLPPLPIPPPGFLTPSVPPILIPLPTPMSVSKKRKTNPDSPELLRTDSSISPITPIDPVDSPEILVSGTKMGNTSMDIQSLTEEYDDMDINSNHMNFDTQILSDHFKITELSPSTEPFNPKVPLDPTSPISEYLILCPCCSAKMSPTHTCDNDDLGSVTSNDPHYSKSNPLEVAPKPPDPPEMTADRAKRFAKVIASELKRQLQNRDLLL